MSNPTQQQTVNKTLAAEDFIRASKIDEGAKVVKKFEDSRLGKVSVIDAKDNTRWMVKEKTFQSKAELEKEIRAVKERLSFEHPNLLKLKDYAAGEKSDFCSTLYWIRLYFQPVGQDLDQELKKRNKFNVDGLNDAELTNMMYQLTSAGKTLNDHKMTHGDINPETIQVDNNENYRLIERFGDAAAPGNNQASKIFSGQDLYVAPELYTKFRAPKTAANVNSSNQTNAFNNDAKADVFSLGLTLLQAGTNGKVQDTYHPNGTIDQANLNKHLANFRNKFASNPSLVNKVSQMVEVKPENRPSFDQLAKDLNVGDLNQVRNQMKQSGHVPNPELRDLDVSQYGIQKSKLDRSKFGGYVDLTKPLPKKGQHEEPVKKQAAPVTAPINNQAFDNAHKNPVPAPATPVQPAPVNPAPVIVTPTPLQDNRLPAPVPVIQPATTVQPATNTVVSPATPILKPDTSAAPVQPVTLKPTPLPAQPTPAPAINTTIGTSGNSVYTPAQYTPSTNYQPTQLSQFTNPLPNQSGYAQQTGVTYPSTNYSNQSNPTYGGYSTGSYGQTNTAIPSSSQIYGNPTSASNYGGQYATSTGITLRPSNTAQANYNNYSSNQGYTSNTAAPYNQTSQFRRL